MMKSLAWKLRKLLKDKGIVDVLIIGSSVKGKVNPGDIDIIVLCNKKDTVIKERIKEIIGSKADIQLITIHEYDKFIWLAIIREGYSVKHNDYLFNKYGIKPIVLYKYSLKSLSNSKKVMFERAIKNFKNIERLSNRVVLVPIQISSDFSDFLRNWEIDIDSQEYNLLPLVRKEEI